MSLQSTIAARPLLKEAEAAELLSAEVATLRRWRWAGKPPRFIKVGAAVRYDLADLTVRKCTFLLRSRV
jgi:predicted site-specific integrase-resolvase